MRRPRSKPPSQRGNRHVKSSRENDDLNDIRYIALHEAGHAVSAVVLGTGLRKVDIKRRPLENGISLGFTDTGTVKLDDVLGKGEEAAMPHMIQTCSGPLAEMVENKQALAYGGFADDMASAHRIAASAFCNSIIKTESGGTLPPEEIARNKDRIDKLVESAVRSANELINGHWKAINKVRDLLVRKKELSGEEVACIVNSSDK
jgi:ATP-dependent Zn protease